MATRRTKSTAAPVTRAAKSTPKEDDKAPSTPVAVSPSEVPDGATIEHPALYFNRELSELDFNWRVLHQAIDDRTPLLERVRFVAITASNLDEFFQKRIGGLKRQEAAGVTKLSPDGRTPTEQLTLMRGAARALTRTMGAVWQQTLKPALPKQAGLNVCDYCALSKREQNTARDYFCSTLYPILTPLAVDPGRPFPFISNLSLSLAIKLRSAPRSTAHFVRLKIPLNRGRWLPLGDKLIPLEQIIAHHAAELFPGMKVMSAHAFRITRNADVDRDEEEDEDLLEMISDELRARRFAPVVRLEVARDMPITVRRFLLDHLALGDEDLYDMAGDLALADCAELASSSQAGLTYPDWRPVVPKQLEPPNEVDYFSVLQRGDLLVHHPYEQFDASVLRLVQQAADDDQVIAIKQTLYRTSEDSPTVAALVKAAKQGKQVAVLLEIKARFDEANNLEWGETLEQAGVHVAYGLVGLKTHAKVTLIIREEAGGIKTYCHVGTGNYHSKTARLYTDLGLLTSDAEIGTDLVDLFHHLTGYAPKQQYTKLLVAPRDMRRAFLELIEQEAILQSNGEPGRIIAKMNGLDDLEIIRALYRASQAGVQIDLIVRGVCRLRPGLPGYSENIRVLSILGRFLEHDRIFYFRNGGEPQLYLGSADWRRRNLSDRVEAAVPIEDPVLQQRLREILESALEDNRSAWDLHADGQYVQRQPAPGEDERGLQDVLMERVITRTLDSKEE